MFKLARALLVILVGGGAIGMVPSSSHAAGAETARQAGSAATAGEIEPQWVMEARGGRIRGGIRLEASGHDTQAVWSFLVRDIARDGYCVFPQVVVKISFANDDEIRGPNACGYDTLIEWQGRSDWHSNVTGAQVNLCRDVRFAPDPCTKVWPT